MKYVWEATTVTIILFGCAATGYAVMALSWRFL